MDYVDNGEEMIRHGENFLGEVARAAWKAYKRKLPKELVTLVQQENNILKFAYLI